MIPPFAVSHRVRAYSIQPGSLRPMSWMSLGAAAGLIEESYLVLHVLLLPRGSGSMTYYVPLVVDA
jgi:hypothetical protein